MNLICVLILAFAWSLTAYSHFMPSHSRNSLLMVLLSHFHQSPILSASHYSVYYLFISQCCVLPFFRALKWMCESTHTHTNTNKNHIIDTRKKLAYLNISHVQIHNHLRVSYNSFCAALITFLQQYKQQKQHTHQPFNSVKSLNIPEKEWMFETEKREKT